MKTAIAIDSLLTRDESIFLLELVLNLFPNSEIYTIAHKQGNILGPIETRPIVSSFLTHRAKDVSVFKKNFWILPSAVKAIPLHKSIEKVIVLSRGYIHGLTLPPHVESFLYLLDWNFVDQKELGWQKLFAPYVNEWRRKAISSFKHVAVSSQALKQKLGSIEAEVIEPTYRTEEYPFVRDEDHNFLFTHHLVYTQGLHPKDFGALIKFLISHGETVRVLGPDAHLSEVKKSFSQVDFAGDHCEATSALYSHQAKAIWSLEKGAFPSKALGALATGRPVVVQDLDVNREFLTQGTFFLKGFDDDELSRVYREVEASYLSLDRKILRRLGLKWNERLFKSRMFKFLQ